MWKVLFQLYFLNLLEHALSTECFPMSGTIMCTCNQKHVLCQGVQEEPEEFQELLFNISQRYPSDVLQTLTIEIENVTVGYNVSFENIKVKNLTMSSGLKSIRSDLFAGMDSSLEYLSLKNNSLTEVPSETLQLLENLHHLVLSTNNITKLKADSFFGLKKLNILELNNNSIEEIKNNAFATMLDLKELFMSHNHLFSLEPSAFEHLSNLQSLSIAGNQLQSLDPLMLQNLPSLQILIIDENNFSSFSEISLISSSLEKLSARKCSIQDNLDAHTLPSTLDLKHIDFSSNLIAEVKPFALTGLKNLHFLNMSNNVIKFLHSNAFSELQNLIHLDLKNNLISVVGTTAFVGLTKLRTIDISNNKLVALLCDYTSDLLSLESINLENNDIKTISAGSLKFSHNLIELQIEGNALDCTCSMSDFASLLQNSSLLKSEHTDSIRCSSPSAVEGLPVIEVDFHSLNCQSASPCESAALLEAETEDYHGDDLATDSTFMTSSTVQDTTNVYITDKTHSFLIQTEATNFDSTPREISITNSNSTYEEISSESSLLNVTESLPTLILTTASQITENAHTTVNSAETHSPISDAIDSTTETEEFSSESTLLNITESLLTSILTTASHITENDHTTVNLTEIHSSISDAVDSTTDDYDYDDDSDLKITQTPNSTSTDSFIQTDTTLTTSSEISFYTTNTPTNDRTIQSNYVTNQTLTSELVVQPQIDINSYSLSNRQFCIGWSISTDLETKSVRCILSYAYKNGRASTYLKCPPLQNDIHKECIKIRAVDEIYELCIKIDNFNTKARIASHCDTLLNTTTLTEVDMTVTSPYSFMPVVVNDSISTLDNAENLTSAYPTTTAVSLTKIPTTSPISNSSNTISNTLSLYEFNVTNLLVNVINISSVSVEWQVNRNEPLFACHLTLTWESYSFNHTEGIFNCTSNTYIISNLRETEMYSICLTTYHITDGVTTLCNHVPYTSYEFSIAKSTSTGMETFPFVILMCLLVAIVILIIVVILRSFYHKQLGSDRYDVTVEENRFSQRKTLSGSDQTIRHSYILNHND